MPNEKIAETHVDNGDEGQFDNTLRISWGPKGGAPEAPDGWVNAGYAHIEITRDVDGESEQHFVVLNASEMDHLIRTLKRIRRKTFDA